MKKYLIGVLLLIASQSFSQTTIFDIAGGGATLPTGWVGNNNVTTTAITSSANNYFLLEAGATSDNIVTNTIDLSGYSSAIFTLNFAPHTTTGTLFATKIEISYNGGTSFSQLELTALPLSAITYLSSGPITLNSQLTNNVKIRISNNAAATGRALRLQALKLVASKTWDLDGNSNSTIRNLGTVTNLDLPLITNNIEKMRITSSGNIGIGINNPLYKLDVLSNNGSTAMFKNGANDNSGFTQIDITRPNGSSNAGDGMSIIALGSNYPTNGAIRPNGGFYGANAGLSGGLSLVSSHSNGEIRFYTGGAADANQQMTITNTGSVGIGTVPSYHKLEIRRDGVNSAHLGLRNESTTPERVQTSFGQNGIDYAYFGLMGTTNPYIYNAESPNDFGFRTDNKNIYFSTNAGVESMATFTRLGKVGIGTTTPSEKLDVVGGNIYTNGKILVNQANNASVTPYALAVNGSAIFTKAVVKLNANWPDYVFEPTYKLPSLKEVEQFIQKNKHLPNMPNADQVKKEGIDLGNTQTIQLQKIEELTLYIIELNKKIEALQKDNIEIKKQLNKEEPKQ